MMRARSTLNWSQFNNISCFFLNFKNQSSLLVTCIKVRSISDDKDCIVIPRRKIPARDWSKSRHVTFTDTP